MMDLKLIVLTNNQILLSQIEEVGSEIGEPDCKLIDPHIVNQSNLSIDPWLLNFTAKNIFMMSSDKILTITEPNENLISKYKELLK